jgi:hypothetical protein
MSGQYARDTSVSTSASMDEIQRLLVRYGADGFMFGQQGSQAAVQFQVRNRRVRFVVTLPKLDDPEIRLTPKGRYARSTRDQLRELDRATRQRYRALALVIKAKLEAVETGICAFDEEFLPHFVLPNGQTVYESLAPRLDGALDGSTSVPLLPGIGKGGA